MGLAFRNTQCAQGNLLVLMEANLAKFPAELGEQCAWPTLPPPASVSPSRQTLHWRYGRFSAQGPIGLCATAGAKLMGASFIIGVESDPVRVKMSKRMGADVVLDPKQCDIVAEVKKLTGGGADVAIEALGLQETFENCLRCLRPGGTLSSLGVYSGKLQVPYDAFAAGIGDYKSSQRLSGRKETNAPVVSMCSQALTRHNCHATFTLDQMWGVRPLRSRRRRSESRDSDMRTFPT